MTLRELERRLARLQTLRTALEADDLTREEAGDLMGQLMQARRDADRAERALGL